eukprot:GILI01000703.1.p1 GENE.GILI01000703.1~~GILI01000703.1.p1  ORF type:complete len:366 (+),score=82.75 GILI01000703.1:59-1099(+)
MNEASRNAGNALQEVLKRNAVDDIKVKGKIATLTASLKSYNTRLSNLQSEARSVQTEADALIKMLWGNSNAAEATKAQAPTPNADPSSDDFGVDVPPIAKKIEQVLGESRPSSSIDSSSETTSSNQPPAPSQKVETLEGDFIREDLTAPKSAQSTSTGTDEDLEIELEVDGSTSNASPVKSANELLADKASIPEITTELHNNGIDFSSCRDADSLRKKYLEFLEGKFKKPSAKPNHNQEQRTTQQPPTPRPPQQQQQQSQYQQAASNTTETGVSSDPYPNGVRKMIDPMKTVWEVKMEIAKERNMDANTVNLWSGKICLEDHKRLYDYPTIQQFPIEVRSKGDTPS